MKLPSLSDVTTKLIALLGLLLGVFVFIGNIYRKGKAAHEAEVKEAQHKVEKEAKEAYEKVHKSNIDKHDKASANAASGDFSDFNAD